MNKYVSHVYVIPEDDRDRQIADGFILHHQVNDTRIQVVPPAGGWSKVLKTFRDEYVPKLRDYQGAHVVMLIDFDDQVEKRKADFEQAIPDEIRTRVFVVGSKQNPETLKKSLKISFEEIGESLAGDCDAGTAEHWDHEQLKHNEAERQRLVQNVKQFLFSKQSVV
jgi:hypothetical protein